MSVLKLLRSEIPGGEKVNKSEAGFQQSKNGCISERMWCLMGVFSFGLSISPSI